MPFFLPVRDRFVRSARRRYPLRALVMLLALSVLVPFGASEPAPALAGGSCTGWQSRYIPPETIRVGRSDGSVDLVNFRSYVGVVMASEWPGWVPREAREAGAVAVKQYAWWYTLEGHHRSSYVNANGKCYDVKDTTVDQLYKPEKVTVGDRIWSVVDETWGLSVRKGGKFFMTGYRAGSSSVCASDADGWRLYAKSVIDCANRGWSRRRIQERYYAPDVTFHWAEAEAAPSGNVGAPISAPTVDLRTGIRLGAKHALVSWDHAGTRPAGTVYQLQRLITGAWQNVKLADPTKPRIALHARWGYTHQFRVRLRDASGNTGPWYSGPRFDARLVQDKSQAMGLSAGDWTRQGVDAASANSVTYARRDGSEAALTFTGRALAVVATKAPDRGLARIYVDGQLLGQVDLYAARHTWQKLVFTHEWNQSATRVVRIEVEPLAGRPLVDIDAILFHR